MFDFQLVEGNIYTLSNLSLKSNDGSIATSLHDRVLEFNCRTALKLFWAYGMPHPGDSFAPSDHSDRMDHSLNYMLSKLARPFFFPDFLLIYTLFKS
jgi:hypothetical protein